MNLRWLWFDHVPPGVDLTTDERRELRQRSRQLRSSHPSTSEKHGSLIAGVLIWSAAEAALLLFVILYVFPMAQSWGARTWVIIGLPLLIIISFWLMFALTFNRTHSRFVRQALNHMGHPVCMKCGYSLRGLHEREKCPECGVVREVDQSTAAQVER